MFLGHYAVALAAKRAAPRTSLGTLVFAAQLLDLMWPVLLLTGTERVRVVPGLMEASALDFEHYPWSHSLLMVVVWALLVGGVYYVLERYPRGAWVVGALVLSHWLLDAPFHRPDLPLWPGSETMVGGGLWNDAALTIALELGLLAAGAAFYAKGTRALDRIGSWGLWIGVGVLVLFYLGSFTSTPASEQALAIGALTLWVFVPWAWWIDRHRAGRPNFLRGG
ncbi:MAG TPA: hypothetical protein VMN78_05875 [Longimicrobiales bacterium]|nr:hypothetical protein [Longimicrobiales bacterium]